MDGTVWEIPYKNNRAHGVSKTYDKHGVLRVKSNYTNGKLDGISKVYSAGGNLIGDKASGSRSNVVHLLELRDDNGQKIFMTTTPPSLFQLATPAAVVIVIQQ